MRTMDYYANICYIWHKFAQVLLLFFYLSLVSTSLLSYRLRHRLFQSGTQFALFREILKTLFLPNRLSNIQFHLFCT